MATKFETRDPDRSDGARLRAALTLAHDQLLSELENMEVVQRSPTPERARWTSARWKLSRASRVRRMVLQDCYPIAMQSANIAELTELLVLRAEESPMLARSRAHVDAWPPDRIEQDWAGYCAASAALRSGMKQRVRAEQRIILPVLERIAGGSA